MFKLFGIYITCITQMLLRYIYKHLTNYILMVDHKSLSIYKKEQLRYVHRYQPKYTTLCTPSQVDRHKDACNIFKTPSTGAPLLWGPPPNPQPFHNQPLPFLPRLPLPFKIDNLSLTTTQTNATRVELPTV